MNCIKCRHIGAKRFGTYGKSRIQRYRCPACKATFSEHRPRPLGKHYTNTETAVRVLELLTEGMSVRAVSRLTGLHKNTVLSLVETIGENCRKVFDAKVRGVHPRFVQADELWSFIHTKTKRLSYGDPSEWGDSYCWIALDSESKAILSYHVGRRDGESAYAFIEDLSKRVEGRFQISTDGNDSYVAPIEEHFGADVSYGQVVKVYATPDPERPDWYAPSRVVSAFRRAISGDPDESRTSTSHVEKLNASVRQHVKRFARLTNAHSKKLANHKAMVSIFVAWYQFCRVHMTTRVTPGMEARLTDHIWSVKELLEAATTY